MIGTDEEKYNWIFDLYDLNGDGFISREEMEDVACSVTDGYQCSDSFNNEISHRYSTSWTLSSRTTIISSVLESHRFSWYVKFN